MTKQYSRLPNEAISPPIGITVELYAYEFVPKYLQDRNGIYRLVPAITPELNYAFGDGSLCYWNLRPVVDQNELMDALIWLHDHKRFADVFLLRRGKIYDVRNTVDERYL